LPKKRKEKAHKQQRSRKRQGTITSKGSLAFAFGEREKRGNAFNRAGEKAPTQGTSKDRGGRSPKTRKGKGLHIK